MYLSCLCQPMSAKGDVDSKTSTKVSTELCS